MEDLLLYLLFWSSLLLILYTYIGYGIALYLLLVLKRWWYTKEDEKKVDNPVLPAVTLIIPAFNEEAFIQQKIRNTLAIRYPPEKLSVFFVTDGSSDNTPGLVRKYEKKSNFSIQLYHQPARRGKIAAVERVMPHVETPIVVFSDANTLLNRDAIRNLVRYYQDPAVGAVAGEKRIDVEEQDDASSAGEGFYWRYESQLKKWDAELGSVVGAAGELFSMRTALFEPVPKDTIIEDFFITMRIVQRGYRVAYAPDAYATERASLSVKEELKRKIRIAAGGLQAVNRLAPLLNVFQYGLVSFQYISHRVLRWTLAPLALLILLVSNLWLAWEAVWFYQLTLLVQLVFYLMATFGWILEKKKIKKKIFFIPYYFCIMNYAVFRGFFRLVAGRQSVLWERAARKE